MIIHINLSQCISCKKGGIYYAHMENDNQL